MLDKQEFSDYLVSKRRNEKAVSDSLKAFEEFQRFLDESGLERLSDFTQDHIFNYIQPNKKTNRRGNIENANKFMLDLAAAIAKGFYGADEAGVKHMASEINAYYLKQYEGTAVRYVNKRASHFLPLPEEFAVNSALLYGLTNSQFVAAFKALHGLIKDIYDNIASAPFDWGYPDFLTTDGYYNRVNDILFAFVYCGTLNSGVITVDANKFFTDNAVKRHKKVELMVAGFQRIGFKISGFSKKAEEFSVSSNNPHIITAISAYATAVKQGFGMFDKERNAYTYRAVECPTAQEYEMSFHVMMDYAPAELVKIQRWLHAEAYKCGYKIDPKEPAEKEMVLYKKGSKKFLLVGWNDSGVSSKTIFRNVFDTHKEQAEQLARTFPDTFKQDRKGICGHCDIRKKQAKPCAMKISYKLFGEELHNCAYASFWFGGVTLDNIGGLLDLFKIENKIK